MRQLTNPHTSTPVGKMRFPPQPAALLAFCVASVAALIIYHLGLPGDFMFDDYPNLKQLGKNGGVNDLSTLKLYLSDSIAGPSGRPVAMLSFLLDTRNWPADPAALKRTNILLHITNGALLFWTLSLVLPITRIWKKSAHSRWIAAIAAAWWILTPFHVSTVLYTVQRMAELSTTFTLIGIIAYLIGRQWLPTSPRRAYIFLSIAVPTTTLFATLSKENGALLPLLLLVVEFVLLARASDSRPDWRWLTVFLLLPVTILVALLAWKGISYSVDTIALRGFTMEQRVLTEARVLMEYLEYLWLPRPTTPGLFHDNIQLSSSLLRPVTTLFSVLAIATLILGALIFRKRWPLASAAIVFFFAAHLMESTVLPLEIYFEHRNYLPSLLLYLPAAQLIVAAYGAYPGGTLIVGVAFFVLLSTLLAAHTSLWADRSLLYKVWALQNPESERAQLSYTNILEKTGNSKQAQEFLRRASDRLPQSLLLKTHFLRLSSRNKQANPALLHKTWHLAETAAFSHEAILSSIAITDDVISGRLKGLNTTDTLSLWEAFSRNQNPAYQRFTGVQILHQRGRLNLHEGNSSMAMQLFLAALNGSRNPETGLKQAAILASNDRLCPALQHLEDTARILQSIEESAARRSYHTAEIEHLRQSIYENAAKLGRSCLPETPTGTHSSQGLDSSPAG